MAIQSIGFNKILKQIASYKNGIFALIIGLVTLFAEQSIELSVYQCPCEAVLRQSYAALFLAVPGLLLLVAGIAVNTKLRKLIAGACRPRICAKKCESFLRNKCDQCKEFFGVLGFVLITPSFWFVLTLLDGDYYACAAAIDAYVKEPNKTCKPNETPFTDDYRNNKQFSQYLGWILAAILSGSAMIIHLVVKCCSSETYLEQKISSNCENLIEQALEKEFQKSIEILVKKEVEKNDPMTSDSGKFLSGECKKAMEKQEKKIKEAVKNLSGKHENEENENDQQV